MQKKPQICEGYFFRDSKCWFLQCFSGNVVFRSDTDLMNKCRCMCSTLVLLHHPLVEKSLISSTVSVTNTQLPPSNDKPRFLNTGDLKCWKTTMGIWRFNHEAQIHTTGGKLGLSHVFFWKSVKIYECLKDTGWREMWLKAAAEQSLSQTAAQQTVAP